ncbi:MAG TPA: hypothetical protein VMU80_06740 [Bryobacteraceae bacterium]|nr:hypothetical protein [Bryobacteraceae bacterium]
MTTRQAGKLFSFALLVLGFGLVQAQAKSDFSGTWKLDVSKSDLGPMPAPDSEIHKITHNDPDLKMNVAMTGGPQGDMNYDVSYTTDGKECVNKLGDNEFKSTLKWEGDDLTINTKGSFNGSDFTAQDRWTLSNDGKTMNVSRHFSSSMGDADMKLVFEKQ